LKQTRYHAYVDKDFEAVIQACAAPRREKDGTMSGTWILPEMMEAYSRLFVLGYAHSFEVYHDNELIGGLYGVRLGHIFFAESMFSKQRDGSKMAMFYLSEWAKAEGIKLIDCQMPAHHLHSLGAEDVSRDIFLDMLKRPE
ncbi:MAG: leucyl/phenylalanyl-tRNA--protein transferase, partial [Ghiorsea sp.]|nr:leucyl/phenylalanyl-tRNA--protein transferase [Ghiorsea sp.]